MTEKKLIETPEGQPNKVEMKAQVKAGKMKGHKVTVLLDADDVVLDQVHGFVDFLRDNAIVGLAVGFVAGLQAQAVVKSLIDSFITPALQMVFGADLQKQQFHSNFLHGGNFAWGKMVYALLNLVVVLLVIYALIKIFKLDKLQKKD